MLALVPLFDDPAGAGAAELNLEVEVLVFPLQFGLAGIMAVPAIVRDVGVVMMVFAIVVIGFAGAAKETLDLVLAHAFVQLGSLGAGAAFGAVGVSGNAAGEKNRDREDAKEMLHAGVGSSSVK